MIIVASLLFSLLLILIIFLIVQPLFDGSKKFQKKFMTETHTTLADMFLFLDLEKIILQTFAIIFFVSFLVYIFTGSILITALLAILLAVTPNILLTFLTSRRKRMLTEQLPDFLLSTSSSMSAGLGVTQAVDLASQETQGPIAQEFGLFLNELRIGVNFESGLDNLNQRVDTDEMQLVVSAMKISREIGGNLAEILHSLADTIRTKIETENKIKTLTAQGRLQGVVMVLLPVAVGVALYFMESTKIYIVQMFTEWYGWLTLTFIITMLSMGYFFIRKIVNIDV